MPYNPDKHHRHSIRLEGYDYQKTGAYFITICIHNGWLKREGMTSAENPLLLGKIVDGQMQLNEYGEAVQTRWLFLPEHYQEVELDEFVLMPNHFHGIIVLGDKPSAGLTKILQEFKTFSAKQVNKIRNMRGAPVWQRNYYDHIIRNEQDLARIREYIINNPAKWSEDTYFVGAGAKDAL